MIAREVAERLGGTEILGKEIRSDLDLAMMIHAGFPASAADFVLRSGLLQPGELCALVVSRKTLVRRGREQKPLSPAQSNRLARLARVLARAEVALGSRDNASRWMRKANRALGGKRPIEMLESFVGAELVERILGRIEHGVYS